MKFSSVINFKDVVLEHNILNGREAKFVKNEVVKSKWVAKTLVKKLKANYKMKLIKVVEDIKITYSTSTTLSQATRVR
ncbi:hypothetical protein CR513_50889, partial [Mucuna pruriens]